MNERLLLHLVLDDFTFSFEFILNTIRGTKIDVTIPIKMELDILGTRYTRSPWLVWNQDLAMLSRLTGGDQSAWWMVPDIDSCNLVRMPALREDCP